jgi:hypothetical protein
MDDLSPGFSSEGIRGRPRGRSGAPPSWPRSESTLAGDIEVVGSVAFLEFRDTDGNMLMVPPRH